MLNVCAVPRVVLSGVLLLASMAASAATPSSGTLSTSQPQLAFTGAVIQPDAAPDGTCSPAHPCENYALTVDLPADYSLTHPTDRIKVTLATPDAANLADYDLYLIDEAGKLITKSTNSSGNADEVAIDAGSGLQHFTVRVVPFTPNGQTYHAAIALVTPEAVGGVEPEPQGPGVPRYTVYAPPAPLGEAAGEPSIGYNPVSHVGMYISGLQTLSIKFPENLDPPQAQAAPALWQDVSYIVTKTASLDPILFTDQHTGRTFVSQLNSVVPPASPVFVGANSLFAFTDDDGKTWTPGQINTPDGSYDHQTVGAGPYPKIAGIGLPPNPAYPGAVYYCAQAGVTALCSRSDDGGLTFNRALPIYNVVSDGCVGIHGHVTVANDGTVYVPNFSCGGGHQAIAVSEDAGTTWTVRRAPASSPPPGILDPSVAPASDGTLYFCYVNGDGHPHVSVSHDKGVTWPIDRDIGAARGIQNSVFVSAVAGDPNRAACGFDGTTTAGDHAALDFAGVWYAYIATTYDGGNTWTTINATPDDPVQREGGICNSGTGCTGNNRNLLDFNGITIDEKGRVIYAFADGCIGDCVVQGPNSFSEKATIVRQSGGKPLFAQFDPVEPQTAAPAFLTGYRDDQAAYLTWTRPDNGGSAITDFAIYRGVDADHLSVVGHSQGKTAFNDRAIDAVTPAYVYNVVAINGQGAGVASNLVSLVVGARHENNGSCATPGVTVVTDPTADETDTLPEHDVQFVSIAEPEAFAGKLVITLKIADLASVPPGFRWGVRFAPPRVPAGQEDYFVSMVSTDGAAPTFTYGNTGTSTAQGSARVFVTLGNLDAGSGYAADGTITMVIDKAKIGGLNPGEAITAVFGSVRATGPSALPSTGGVNQTIPDSTGGGSYLARPADLCLPNTAPLASLAANVPGVGTPLSVIFDGSGSSDADAIDTIARYTFNFGDGNGDVVQTSPRLVHVFDQPGLYGVRMVVADSRGKVSSNTALRVILAKDITPDPFRFADKTGVPTGIFRASDPVTVSGLSGTTFISISGGQYQLNGGAWTNQPGRVTSGDTLVVRHLTAPSALTARRSFIKVGSYATTFRTVTGAYDRTPDAFSFARVNGALPGSLVESEVLTLSGFNAAADVAPGDGLEYRIDGGAWTSAAGVLRPQQTLQVRQTAAAGHQTLHRTFIRVGTVFGVFATLTR